MNGSQASLPRPKVPNVHDIVIEEEIKIDFDDSQDDRNSNACPFAYSADNFLLRNDAIDFHKKEKGYK